MTTDHDRLKQLPPAARAYVASVVVAGAALFALFLPRTEFDQPGLFAALLLLGVASSTFKVYLPLPRGRSTMSVSYGVDFVSLLLLGPNETMLVAAASVIGQCTLNAPVRTPLYRTVFSAASVVITVCVAGLAFWLLGGHVGSAISIPSAAGPLLGMATIYFLVNTGLVAIAIAVSSRQSVRTVWHRDFLWSAPSYFVSVAAAALAATLITYVGYWLAPLTMVPLYVTYRSYRLYMGRIASEQRQVKQSADLHLATVEALACAIDAKDQLSYSHIWRLQLYAARLAEAMGLADLEVQGIKTAALLHDIGKLAVPEHILSKPEPLTNEELQKIRIHPQVGAEILAGVPFPYPVGAVILSHHERWDGAGYPQGLKGEAIPLGARILSLVDYFDAVTTERPHRKPLGHDEAVELIRREGGAAFDPQIVATFIQVLPSVLAECAAKEEPMLPAPIRSKALAGIPSVSPAQHGRKSAFENIALAHREIYALYEISQGMSMSLSVADTMALISSKLAKVVPWSGCSLFLHDSAANSLRCAFAVGLDAPRLLDRLVVDDCVLSSLAASNRRTLINADPRVIFEAVGLEGCTELKAAMICPLFFNETFIGLFSLYHVDPNGYTQDHRRLLECVADQAGTVLRNAILFEQTQSDALTDSLTGLPNRRWLSVQVAQELSRADRTRSEVAVILIDIDDFKAINDSHGHPVGDRALREVAKALRAVCRPYDFCARYAGDEFVLVLSNCPREAAEVRALELQQRIQEIQLEMWPERALQLGASAGVSVFPQDGATYEVLIASADHRMYRDKARRRVLALPQAARILPLAQANFSDIGYAGADLAETPDDVRKAPITAH